MDVRPVVTAELDAVLPLIAAYQRFYGAEPDQGRNRAFFERFLEPSEDGLLLAAFSGSEPLGHACLYWTFSSVTAVEVVLLNDLFVVPEHRGEGVGDALISASLAVARDRGAARLRWYTAPDNTRAQRLYDATGAERTEWVEYELDA